MTYTSIEQRTENNGLAVFSMVSGIVGWVLFVALLCVNFFLLPVIAVATLGIGALLYLCVLPAGCLSPIAWVIGIVTGHASLNQIRTSGQAGEGMAKAGLIMGYIGIGLTIISICAVIFLVLAGISIPGIDQILYDLGIY